MFLFSSQPLGAKIHQAFDFQTYRAQNFSAKGEEVTEQEPVYRMYCGIFINSPSFSADWWATMPATVMVNARAISTIGFRFWSIAITRIRRVDCNCAQ